MCLLRGGPPLPQVETFWSQGKRPMSQWTTSLFFAVDKFVTLRFYRARNDVFGSLMLRFLTRC